MGQVIGEILPFAIGIAISPVPIIATILMLLTPNARRNGLAFLGGWAGGLFVVGAIVLIAANGADVATSSGPSHAASVLKLILGFVLLLAAARQWRGRPKAGEDAPLPKWMAALDTFTAGKAIGVGALLSGVNPKNLILNIGACTAIAQAGLATGEQLVALLVVVVVGSIGIIAPVGVYFAMGDKSTAVLGEWKDWLSVNNGAVMAVLFIVFGFSLIGKGIAGLS